MDKKTEISSLVTSIILSIILILIAFSLVFALGVGGASPAESKIWMTVMVGCLILAIIVAFLAISKFIKNRKS